MNRVEYAVKLVDRFNLFIKNKSSYIYIQGVPPKSIFKETKGHRVKPASGADLFHLLRGLLQFDAVLSQIFTSWHSLNCVHSSLTNLY